MPKTWTLEELKALPLHERSNVYRNAGRLAHTPDGAALKKLIEEAGLPFSEDACLRDDDPITLKMHEVIFSKEGREAALSSTKQGRPALEGVDPLLCASLGSDYGPHNMGTQTAGSILGQLMRSLGYKKAGQKPLAPHCVARSAVLWV